MSVAELNTAASFMDFSFSRASRTMRDTTQVVTFLSVTKNVGEDRKGNAF